MCVSLLFFFRRGSERKSVPGLVLFPLVRWRGGKEGEFLPARIVIFSEKSFKQREALTAELSMGRLFVLFPQKFARAAYIFPRKQSMVDFETRVFAGTPVTFAKIPGDPAKFVPLQYSLMPFPVRPFVFFLIKVYSPKIPCDICRNIGTKDGERSAVKGDSATRFCSISRWNRTSKCFSRLNVCFY